jgi:hypothetical protein
LLCRPRTGRVCWVAPDEDVRDVCGVKGIFGFIANDLLDDCKKAVCAQLNDPDFRTPFLYRIDDGRLTPDSFNGGFINVSKQNGTCAASLN